MSEPKKEDPYQQYQKKANKEIKKTTQYLQKLSDSHQKVLISAREKFNYDIEGNRDKFADELTSHFERNIKEWYKIGSDADDRFVDELLKKHIGVTKKELRRIIQNTESQNDIYKNIEQEISQADSQFKQQHFYSISHDYIDISDPKSLDFAIKYMGLDKISSFNKDTAKAQPDVIKRLFIRHGLEGKVSEQHIPVEMRKKVKTQQPKKS
mgnify:CR=1 FL=1|jgi:hypothetical protein